MNNISVLCIWLEERVKVKREERDILLRPLEAEQKQKQKRRRHAVQRGEERVEEGGRPDIAVVAAELKEEVVQNVLGCHSKLISNQIPLQYFLPAEDMRQVAQMV